MNIGDCYVQRLRTTWEYTKRHRSPPLLHTVTSHLLEATSGEQTLTPADASPHWLNTLYTRYVTASTSGMTSQRWHPVTRAWPISRSEWLIDLTYIQVDWHVKETALTCKWYKNSGDTWWSDTTSGDVTGSTSQRRHLVTRHDIWWRHRKYVTEATPGDQTRHLMASPEVRHRGDTWWPDTTSGDVTGSTSQRRHLVTRHDIWWRHRKYVISRDTF